MLDSRDYYETARKNEAVFRNVLRDLRKNRARRPMGAYVPKNLDTEANLDEIFRKYSQGNRFGIFTINSFSMPEKTKAIIEFQDLATLSGGLAQLEYLINKDNSVRYHKPGMVLIS